MPVLARRALRGLAEELETLGERVKAVEASILAWHKGNDALRRLLVLGATAVIRHARTKTTAATAWLRAVLERRPVRLASVAQANKTARIAWAVLTRGESYRVPLGAEAAAA